MEENKEETSILNSINADFERSTQEGKRKKKGFWNKRKTLIVIACAIPLVIIAIIFSTMGATQIQTSTAVSKAIEKYQDVLTEEEKTEWREKKADSDEVYIQINTRIPLKTASHKADIRLINPPYSKYKLQVEIQSSDEAKTVWYQSEVLEPGTIIETADFLESLKPGEYDATVKYTFFDQEEKEIGAHPVAVKIEAE